MKAPIDLTPYDPTWTALFETERIVMQKANMGWFRAVHHVGSTAIPGIAAKAIIDILVALRCDEDGRACADAMLQLGYEYRGDGGIPGRHYYRKGTPHTHHVHMWEENHQEFARLLRFRDYLRSHPREALSYEALKRDLAVRFVSDTQDWKAA